MRFLGSFFGAALMQIDEQKPRRACKPDQEERDPGDLIAAAGVIDGTYERRGKVPASTGWRWVYRGFLAVLPIILLLRDRP